MQNHILQTAMFKHAWMLLLYQGPQYRIMSHVKTGDAMHEHEHKTKDNE